MPAVMTQVTCGRVSTCQEMSWFWYACGYPDEGRRWLEQATQRVKGDEPEEIAVAHGLALILLQQGEGPGRAAALGSVTGLLARPRE